MKLSAVSWCLCAIILAGMLPANAQLQLSGKLVVSTDVVLGNTATGPKALHVWTDDLGLPYSSMLFTLRLDAAVPRYPDIKTGDAVVLAVDPLRSGRIPGSPVSGNGSAGTLQVTGWDFPALATSKGVYYDGSEPLVMRSITWVVSEVCAESNVVQLQEINDLYFGSPATTAAAAALRLSPVTLERQWDTCSGGAVSFKRFNDANRVIALTLPCAGTRANGAAWNGARGCGWNELYGWVEAAVNATRALGIEPSLHPRRIMLLPPTLGHCRFSRRATYGCDNLRGCDVWIKTDRSNLLELLMAGLGGTMLLESAAAPTNARSSNGLTVVNASGWTWATAGDGSCPMGSTAGTFRCFNGPNSYKLMFQWPAHVYNRTSTFPGMSSKLRLPAASASPASLLHVLPDWLAGYPAASNPAATRPQLWVQYRPALAADAGLAPSVAGRVTVHAASWSAFPEARAEEPTRLLVALALGESVRIPDTRIIIKFSSVTSPTDPGGVVGASAGLDVCRYERANETGEDCEDGVDQDCDGLIDADDPDCAGFGR